MLRVRILEQKFYSQIRNGETFASNLTDYTDYLAGNVGDKIKAVTSIDVAWWTSASTSTVITISGSSMTRSSGDFTTEGWALGDTIVYVTAGGVTVASKTITFLDPTTIITDTAWLTGTVTVTSGIFYGRTPMEGCIFKYNLIENAEVTNYNSKIDGTTQEFFADGIVTAAGTPVTLNPAGVSIQKAWLNGSVTSKFVGLSPDGNIQYFEIEHEFIILPYYVDGYLPNLQTGTNPLLFDGANSLKYVIDVSFRDVVSNPNTNKNVVLDDRLGTVGFFNEAFNGFTNNYALGSTALTDGSGGTLDGLSVSNTTNVEIRVNSLTNSFGVTDPIMVGVSYLPDSINYVNLEDFETNFIYDSKRTIYGAGAVNSTVIQNFTATRISSSQIVVNFETVFTPLQQTKLNDTRFFAIWVDVGDGTLTNQTDDRVNILAKVDQYDYSADVPDLAFIRGSDHQFFPHPIDYTLAGYTDFKGWMEDGYLWNLENFNVRFYINDAGDQELPIIQSGSFLLAAYNESTGDLFELDRYDFDVLGNSVFVPVSGYSFIEQKIEIDTERGFTLLTGDQFNFVKWTSLGFFDNQTRYDIKIAFKLRWEEWINNPDVNTIFYDPTEPNNGFNMESYRYSLKNGYAIVTVFDVDVQSDTNVTRYRWISPDGNVQLWDKNDTEDPKTYCAEINTYDSIGNNLNGNYLTDENTFVKARFTRCDAGVLTVDDETISGVIRFDIENGGLYSIHELSTFRDPEGGSPLIPLAGETHTKITVDPALFYVDLECMIDYTQLIAGSTYCITGRVWWEDKDGGGIIIGEDDEIIVIEGKSGNPEIPFKVE
jgi:hypothetical protein